MEYGKFNSAEELLKGYNELEKSFTQKCQELSAVKQRQLNGESADLNSRGGISDGQSSPSDETRAKGSAAAEAVANAVPAGEDTTPAVCNPQAPENTPIAQIKQYLAKHPETLDLLFDGLRENNAAPRVINGGGNVFMTPPSRPKTIREASAMAKELFK